MEKLHIFPFLRVFICFFSFPKNLEKFFVFFSWKSLHPTHSLDFKPGKKKQGGKKKQHFYSLTRFLPKSGQNQTFPGKKIRYSNITFISTMLGVACDNLNFVPSSLTQNKSRKTNTQTEKQSGKQIQEIYTVRHHTKNTI